MGLWERAVFYHALHAVGLLVVSLMPRLGVTGEASAHWVCTLLLLGILLFSGSLYLLAVTGVRTLGAVTPLGGVSFIAAWLVLAWVVIR